MSTPAKPPEAEVLAVTGNMAVVRVVGRRYPGLLMQGDTLSTLVEQSRAICSMIATGDSDLADEAADLREQLEEALREYERVLAANGIELPYVPE